jgi:hypothetical protein
MTLIINLLQRTIFIGSKNTPICLFFAVAKLIIFFISGISIILILSYIITLIAEQEN